MFGQILSLVKKDDLDNSHKANRAHPRRAGDCCVAMINDKMYPLENWSVGGLLAVVDDRKFSLNQECKVKLRFKLRDEMIDIEHRGKVIRKGDNKIALTFPPMPKKNETLIQKIIDDFVAQRFAESQHI